MSKLAALFVAFLLVGVSIPIVMLVVFVISILTTLEPIGWLVLGLGALLNIMIAIGVYQFDKHYLN